MKAINKQDLINYLKKSPENLNFNIFGTMLDDFRNTYETDEQIVNKIKNIITNIIEDGGSISPEDDTITELVDLITELLPEKMIIKPVGILEITENDTGIDVTEYASANVNVETYEADFINFIERDMTSVVIPAGVSHIGAHAFDGCTSLQSVKIPNSMRIIDTYAFNDCVTLSSVNVPSGVTQIAAYAFAYSVTTIYLPATLAEFGNNALFSRRLTDIYFEGTQAQWQAITNLSGAGIPAGATVHYEYTPE